MAYKIVQIGKDTKKERLKELKVKGVKNLSKTGTDELLELVLDILNIR